MPDVLIVEDDEAIATGLALNLKLAGHSTTIARDGNEAVLIALRDTFDLALLDINLPYKNGLEVLASIRAADNLMPVIVVSARDDEYDKVAALRLGADDYVTKPFALAELLARIEAVLRRCALARTAPPPAALVTEPARDTLQFDDVVVDVSRRRICRAGAEVHLTNLELELLLFFLRSPHIVFSRKQLYAAVWGQEVGAVRTVDNFVSQLRRRLEVDPDQPRHFITVRGAGYRFDP